jgi:hypothetical protein
MYSLFEFKFFHNLGKANVIFGKASAAKRERLAVKVFLQPTSLNNIKGILLS